jgi:sialate O-acetylesterase
MKFFSLFTCFLFLSLNTTIVTAGIWLPSIYGDNMVLQSEQGIAFRGKAIPEERVTVCVLDSGGNILSESSATVGGNREWALILDALPAGLSVKVEVRGSESGTVTYDNVLTGEVWLCSGQSNMRMTVAKANNGAEEIANANYPQIRLFMVELETASVPLGNLSGKWVLCSPETVGEFSGVGYYFGRYLHQKLQRPVGLISSNWGGTPIQSWIPGSAMNTNINPRTVAELTAFQRYKNTPNNERKRDRFGDWIYGVNFQKAPTFLYNAMIHPLIPYPIRGVIWYQGESNDRLVAWGGPDLYRILFPMLVNSWRAAWGKDFPFLYVELANFKDPQMKPVEDESWANIREAQSTVLALEHTYTVPAIDVGEADKIHFGDKQTVGARLAMAALGQVYHRLDTTGLSPRFSGYSVDGNAIRLTFDNVATGLHTDDGQPSRCFAIRGEGGEWQWGQAQIAGKEIVVSHPDIANPVAVRYAWASNPDVNVYNASNLPLMPFRTDVPDYEAMSEGKASSATLIYDDPISVPNDSGSVFLNSGTQVFGMNLGNGGSGTVSINGVDFANGGRSGLTQTLAQNGITVTMTVDAAGSPQTQASGGVSAGLYTNTPSRSDIFDLLNVGYLSGGGDGAIRLDFSGLEIGQTYRVQTFHIIASGGQGSREMLYSIAGGNQSMPFDQTYSGGRSYQDISAAVTQVFTFQADAPTLTLELLPKDRRAGIDRSYINAISVYAVDHL